MADVAFLRFANAFQDRLNDLGYSLRRAEEQWPDTDRAMLSRAVNAKTLSAGNFLLLCDLAGLDPYLYIERARRRRVTLKSISDQLVTPFDQRETGDAP